MKKIVTFIILFSAFQLSAQKKYSFVTSTNNISGNFAVLNFAELNDKQNAIFSVMIDNENKAKNPHPIGVWYTGTKWAIYNQDRVNMPVDVTFTVSISPRSLIATSTAENINNDKMFIDAEPLNGNSNAKFSVIQNWNPTGSTGIYNNSDIEVSYNEGMGKWVLQNKSGAAIPNGVSFNIVELVDAVASNPIPPRSNPPSNPPPVVSSPSTIINTNAPVVEARSDAAIYTFLTNNQGPTYPSTKTSQPFGNGESKGNGVTDQPYKIINYTTENIVFNPQADALYAGSIIQSKPYFDATELRPLNKPTKAGTITMVGGNGPGGGSRSRTLTSNSLAAYNDAVNEIIQGINLSNSTGSNDFKFNSCRTAEQGLIEAKVSVRTTNFRARGDFSYEYNFEKSVVVGVLTQKYYSINYTPPSDKQNLFAPGVTLAQLQGEGLVSNDNRPAFISQVDYGRIFILVAESEMSQSELKAFMQGNYNGATTQVDAEARFNQLKNTFQLSIRIMSVGSNNNQDELNDITPEAFKNFLKTGATASVQNPGAIIGYRVRDLVNNRDIPTMLTADYSELEWDGSTVDNVEYTVKPGGCPDCIKTGLADRTTTGAQLTLRKGDVVNFTATGRATHGPWLWGDAKGPEGQIGERTDANDKMPCATIADCKCPRYALIANIPESQSQIWSCIGAGKNNFVVKTNMSQPLGFTFNDYNTSDGEGQFSVRVSRIPYHTVIRRK